MKTPEASQTKKTRVMICVGPGGVGKTTLAAALGMAYAKKGHKILVMTIDPSERLVKMLNLNSQLEPHLVATYPQGGELHACAVQHAKVFDRFVFNASQNKEVADRLMKNILYQQLVHKLSGSQDFSALENLYYEHQKKLYDYIILDTPPMHHVVDFLKSPQQLRLLFSDGVAKWFRRDQGKDLSFLQKVFNAGTAKMLAALEKLTGSDFVAQLSDFFNSLETWRFRLLQRLDDVDQLLKSQEATYVMITTAQKTRLIEAQTFSRELKEIQVDIQRIFLNRSSYAWEFEPLENVETELKSYAQEWRQFIAERDIRLKDFKMKYSEKTQVYLLTERINADHQVLELESIADELTAKGVCES